MRVMILGEVPPTAFRGVVVAWTDCLPCVNVSGDDVLTTMPF